MRFGGEAVKSNSSKSKFEFEHMLVIYFVTVIVCLCFTIGFFIYTLHQTVHQFNDLSSTFYAYKKELDYYSSMIKEYRENCRDFGGETNTRAKSLTFTRDEAQ